MSERKVLNKYYPPDFDPSKIPKLKLPRNRQYSIRIMSPFNMRCNTCGEYIYKGKKFNSRKETVEDEDYLGLRIFRFYIKCPRCVSEIAFKTDLRTTDYALEDGATRNFEASKTAEEMAQKERQAKEEEEMNNPMKVLENRTKASRQEMEQIDALEELKELNSRMASVDHTKMLEMHNTYTEEMARKQAEEEEELIKSLFGKKGDTVVKRLHDDDDEDDDGQPAAKKSVSLPARNKPTDVLTQDVPEEKKSSAKKPVWERSVGMLPSKLGLAGLVRKKVPKSENEPVGKKPIETVKGAENFSLLKTSNGTVNNTAPAVPDGTSSNAASTSKASSALTLLGNYSDTDSSDGD
ncbi:splicing factor YJU2-like [Liolophura sinensis]|uniref:splicing factor YJU2-like n=1 Tax=Liolophura sinensis TaxID=3198878 RepID=UPI00315925CD